MSPQQYSTYAVLWRDMPEDGITITKIKKEGVCLQVSVS